LSKRSRLNFEFEENIPEDPSSNNEIISASMYSNSGGLTTSLSNRDISPLIHCLPSSSSCPQLYKISYYLSKPVMPGLHYAFYRLLIIHNRSATYNLLITIFKTIYLDRH